VKTSITVILLVFSLSGCADSARIKYGSEAVVYQENHHFVIEAKHKQIAAQQTGSESDIEAQLDYIIASFTPGIEQTRWTLSYQIPADKAWIVLTEVKLLNQGVSPAKIKIIAANSNSTDSNSTDSNTAGMEIHVGQYKIKTQTCDRNIYGIMNANIGCFVDTMRLKHIRDPETLAVKGSE